MAGYVPPPYDAEVILLDGRPTIRVRQGSRLVGYFTHVEDIKDHGLPIEMADLHITDADSNRRS